MKIIEWLLGSKCGECGQRTKSVKNLDSTSGAENPLCDACYTKLMTERKRQEEKKRQEQKQEEEQKRKKEEEEDKESVLKQIWKKIGFDDMGDAWQPQPTLIILGESTAAFESRLQVIKAWLAKGDLVGTTWVVLQASNAKAIPRLRPEVFASVYSRWELSSKASRPLLLLGTCANPERLKSFTDRKGRELFVDPMLMPTGKTWTAFNRAIELPPDGRIQRRVEEIITGKSGPKIDSPVHYDTLLREIYQGYYTVRDVVAIGDGTSSPLIERLQSRGTFIIPEKRPVPAAKQPPTGQTKHDRAKAEKLYKQAVDCMESGGLKADAIRFFNAAIEADPSFPEPYDGLHDVYFSMGRAEDAIAAINKYIELKGKAQ